MAMQYVYWPFTKDKTEHHQDFWHAYESDGKHTYLSLDPTISWHSGDDSVRGEPVEVMPGAPLAVAASQLLIICAHGARGSFQLVPTETGSTGLSVENLATQLILDGLSETQTHIKLHVCYSGMKPPQAEGAENDSFARRLANVLNPQSELLKKLDRDVAPWLKAKLSGTLKRKDEISMSLADPSQQRFKMLPPNRLARINQFGGCPGLFVRGYAGEVSASANSQEALEDGHLARRQVYESDGKTVISNRKDRGAWFSSAQHGLPDADHKVPAALKGRNE